MRVCVCVCVCVRVRACKRKACAFSAPSSISKCYVLQLGQCCPCVWLWVMPLCLAAVGPVLHAGTHPPCLGRVSPPHTPKWNETQAHTLASSSSLRLREMTTRTLTGTLLMPWLQTTLFSLTSRRTSLVPMTLLANSLICFTALGARFLKEVL